MYITSQANELIMNNLPRYELIVNTDPYITTLFKEIRNLQALQFRVPYSMKVLSDEARSSYPSSTSLHEACRIYMQVCQTKITATGELLLAAHHAAIQDQIYQGMQLRWSSDRVEDYARKLCESVYAFQDKIHELNDYITQMDGLISSLDEIELVGGGEGVGDQKGSSEDSSGGEEDGSGSLKQKFFGIFGKMQAIVDDMNLKNYSNLAKWVSDLAETIEAKLVTRLSGLIQAWTTQFQRWPQAGTSLIQDATYAVTK